MRKHIAVIIFKCLIIFFFGLPVIVGLLCLNPIIGAGVLFACIVLLADRLFSKKEEQS
jgi:hypothetical protein